MDQPETSDSRNDGGKDDARLGYETAVGLVGLVSEEVYSRSGAMLIVHGLLLTVLFNKETPLFLALWAVGVGLLLCGIWFVQVFHGLYYQDYFRSLAVDLEKRWFQRTFTIFHSGTEPGIDLTAFAPRSARGVKRFSSRVRFEISISLVIAVFVLTYLVMVGYLIWFRANGTAV